MRMRLWATWIANLSIVNRFITQTILYVAGLQTCCWEGRCSTNRSSHTRPTYPTLYRYTLQQLTQYLGLSKPRLSDFLKNVLSNKRREIIFKCYINMLFDVFTACSLWHLDTLVCQVIYMYSLVNPANANIYQHHQVRELLSNIQMEK